MTNYIEVAGNSTMSSNEIAELTGKRHDHVLRDCDKLNEMYLKLTHPKIGGSEYTDTTGRKLRSYDLTKIQTLDLMTGYSLELRIKVNHRWQELENNQIKPMSELDLLAQSVKILQEQDLKLKAIENRVLEIENKPQINAPIQQFSIMGHCNNIKKQTSLTDAAQFGRKCTKMCNELGLIMGKIADPRYGSVKIYPIDVLEQIINTL